MVLNNIKTLLWIITTGFLIILGGYFTWKLHGTQFRFIKMIKQLTMKDDLELEINSFSSLMLSLAGRIGVGSISGIALAIYLTGPGVVFWIWIISFISAIVGYVESYLGVKYKERINNIYLGGPSYYIKNGLKKTYLGTIYSIMIIICYCGGFMLIQSNTITKATMTLYSNINPLFIGLTLCILTWGIIFRGIKTLTKVTSKIVPIMSICYIGMALFIVITRINIIPEIFERIITDAFTYKSFIGGFMTTMLLGIQRGIFSNEGGIGTGSMAAAINGSNNCEQQGLIQMIGIYVTSFLICTSTALIILASNYRFLKISDANGIELALNAFNEHFGSLGNIFLIIAIFLFAFSTILSGYFYGETSLKFIFKNKEKNYLNLLKLGTGIVIFLGTIIASEILWNLTDIMVACLMGINLYALWKLRKEIKK